MELSEKMCLAISLAKEPEIAKEILKRWHNYDCLTAEVERLKALVENLQSQFRCPKCNAQMKYGLTREMDNCWYCKSCDVALPAGWVTASNYHKLIAENDKLKALVKVPGGLVENALSFAGGALEDHVGLDDGLDGSAGMAVIGLIDECIAKIIPNGEVLLRARTALEMAIYSEDGWEDGGLIQTIKDTRNLIAKQEGGEG